MALYLPVSYYEDADPREDIEHLSSCAFEMDDEADCDCEDEQRELEEDAAMARAEANVEAREEWARDDEREMDW